MSGTASLDKLTTVPSLGWIVGPSPVTELSALARSVGLDYLGVKRDELLSHGFGGSKLRKLDVLLATEPFKSASRWVGLGAIGSGHLVATAAAASELGRALEAHCFWEPLSFGVVENLSFTATRAAELNFHSSRLALGLGRFDLLRPTDRRGTPVIPPGATCPPGIAGMVRAGLELGDQVRAGLLPEPHRVYVALGSGGAAAGLALGLGLAGLSSEVVAVATVERLASPAVRLAQLVRRTRAWLAAHGVEAASTARVAPLRIDRSQLGPGYGAPSPSGLAACELLAREGLGLEPVYTGKAMAALLADASRGKAGRVLFWATQRRGPLPSAEDWRSKLPPRLSRRLVEATRPRRVGRRVVLVGAAAAGAGLAVRLTGYPRVAGWAGKVLLEREALVLAAGAEALLPPVRAAGSGSMVAANVDRFLEKMPPAMVTEVRALLGLVEHGTGLGLRLRRFTNLDPESRQAFLAGLSARGGLLAVAARGFRDLVLVGYYQEPTSWKALGYPGPWVPLNVPVTPYEAFRAADGELPKGVVR